jgi:hypothetical protein
MRWRSSPTLLPGLVLLVLAGATPDSSAQDIFVTPITNAPFMAVVNVERSVVQNDGSVDNLKTFREIGRDSRGRIHNEMRSLVAASSDKTPELIRIHLYDPQTRTSTMIDLHEQTFFTQTVNRPPSAVPPDRRYSASAAEGPQNEFVKQEDLGVHEMEGVQVHGVRETQTIPAESGGGKDIVVSDEYWYSEDLRINLMIKHSDPRTGSVKMMVAQVTRTEPDPAFFEIPEGYKPAGAAAGTDQ